MLEKLFKESLRLAGLLRPQYRQSLGNNISNWEDVFYKLDKPIPKLFRIIYSNISGTERDIKDQKLLDFTPGYRLIHISELIDECDNLKNILIDVKLYSNEVLIPILGNYSSDYICYHKNNDGDEFICSLRSDSGEPIVMYNSPEKFLETVCKFYKQGVYFLDSNGFLDYDMDKEHIVGSSINHGCEYWDD